jgi:hypothetical protein
MEKRYFISLNFLPILAESFSFTIYRQEDRGQRKEVLGQEVSKQSLPIDKCDPNSRSDYWVSLKEMDSFESFECHADFNQFVTRNFLYDCLLNVCQSAKPKIFFSEEKGLVENRLSFVLANHPEGEEIVWLQPYYLKSAKRFGFLIDYKFKRSSDVAFSKRIQQLSLSLDDKGRENRNFYSDRYDKIQWFINCYLDNLFPLSFQQGTIKIAKKLILLSADALAKKTYVFNNNKTHESQYLGIKRHKPLITLDESPVLFFVYRQQDRLLSLDLYKALRGESFPNVFPGTHTMFGFRLSPDNVHGISVSNFKETEMLQVRDKVLSFKASHIIVILIAPWDDEEIEDSNDYFKAKHIFVSAQIPSQVVRLHTLERDTRLQWSTSNIALQSFAKLGGKPWKVQPKHGRCLIVGVGQSHRVKSEDGKRIIERYYAYSVLSESSGLFKELRVLGRADNSKQYLIELRESIAKIVDEHRSTFQRFVIHAPYKISKGELDAIRSGFESFAENTENQFVVLKINSRNKFFGYSHTNNSLVPFESTYVTLAWNEYLVWFEGLQYHNPKVARRYDRPIHIKFYYSSSELSLADQLDYLQDAVNLSGANWRGFNAKNLPVSIYYAQLIARFANKFAELDLPEVDLDNLNPWFL